jgi:hypothetical protein
VHRREDQIALILAIVVIRHDDDLAPAERVDRLRHVRLRHGSISRLG